MGIYKRGILRKKKKNSKIQEKKKENKLSTKKKSVIKEKRKNARFWPSKIREKKNTQTTKKKKRNQDFDQENKEVFRSYFFPPRSGRSP